MIYVLPFFLMSLKECNVASGECVIQSEPNRPADVQWMADRTILLKMFPLQEEMPAPQ